MSACLVRTGFTLLAAVLLAACQTGHDDPTLAREYAPELGVELRQMQVTESGLRYQILSTGEGRQASAGDQVRVHYTGHLPDGSQFDSSRERGQPFSFLLGTGQVIRGWDEGVAGMREGERRLLVIPPRLGYGERGAGMGLIPPDATLVFDVELIEVVE